jgi:hypothetical protein
MKTIHIFGINKSSKRWYKEFNCFGDKHPDLLCGACNLRFKCFTERENIEISAKEFPFEINYSSEMNAEKLAKYIAPTVKIDVIDIGGKMHVRTYL